MTRPILTALFCTLLLVGCSDDDNARNIRHYYYPVWSHDGSLIIAAYEDDFADPNTPRAEIFELALRNNATSTETILTIKPGLLRSRYFITPENNAIAVVRDGLDFYDLNGTLISSFAATSGAGVPHALTFSTTEKSFYWATLSNNTVHLVRTRYSDNAWEPTNESVLQSFPATSKPMDIRLTNQNSIVVALEEGRMLEYPFVGALRHEFQYAPYPQNNPWLRRMEYAFDDRANASYVYTMNDIGLIRFDFTRKSDSLIVDGQGKYVVGFDAEDGSDAVVFEVSDGDIYNYKPALFRRAYSQRMPKFSPDGKRLASVAYMNPGEDSLHITR